MLTPIVHTVTTLGFEEKYAKGKRKPLVYEGGR